MIHALMYGTEEQASRPRGVSCEIPEVPSPSESPKSAKVFPSRLDSSQGEREAETKGRAASDARGAGKTAELEK